MLKLKNHATPWNKHGNATRAHQSAHWDGYLENANFWTLYICLSAPDTPQSPSQLPSSKGSCRSIWTSPSTSCTFWSSKGQWCSHNLCPYPTPRGQAFIRVFRSTVYLHCLTAEMLLISSVQPCSTAIQKIIFSCSHRFKEWKTTRVMPFNIYQIAKFTLIVQFP